MVNNAKELREIFFNYSQCNGSRKLLFKGIYVDGKTRKSVMTDIDQARITLNGWVSSIEFENLGGGVYRAFIETKGE